MKQIVKKFLNDLGPTPEWYTAYVRNGCKPWSQGYSKFKDQFIREVLANDDLMRRFREAAPLPENYGPRLDERAVEYPWVISRLRPGQGRILDAGSTFNTPLILDRPEVSDRTLIIYTLYTDWITLRPNVSYLFGDLRETLFKDELFDSIVCISTLEHIGMGLDIRKYSLQSPFPEADYDSHKQVLREFYRLLRPGGQLLLTVPFGRYEDHGWLQQFDQKGVQAFEAAFGGTLSTATYYRYQAEGWSLATPDECADAKYFNIHATPEFDQDYAAAARSVACLEYIKAA